MAGQAAVALLRLVLEDPHLGAAHVPGDDRLDLHLFELVATEHDIGVAAIHDRPQADLGALVGRQVLDEQAGALLGAVLLAA